MTFKDIIQLIYHRILNLSQRYLIESSYRFNQWRVLKRIKGKKQYKCVFFALMDSVWKCDSLYKQMLDDPRFEPIILICPVVNYGTENMIRTMEECANFFKAKGYDYILSYDKHSDNFIDVKKQLNPDIIFYTNPYKGLIDKRYYIDQFKDVLTCYIPYFYASGNAEMFYNLPFHHYVWRYFCESEFLKKEFEKAEKRNLRNVVPTGYCVFDEFKEELHPSDKKNIKIIWAPHHMITTSSNIVLRNSFLRIYDLFFSLAQKYEGAIEFIFRPHPVLKNKLCNHPEWGKQKTDQYYKKWKTTPYCRIEERGDYIPLFYESDAIIHDCGSFITEYLYVNKPALFTDKTIFDTTQYWKSAIEAIDCYYRAETELEIEDFINNVVICRNDILKDKRAQFFKKYLYNERPIAHNIINNIAESIEKSIL